MHMNVYTYIDICIYRYGYRCMVYRVEEGEELLEDHGGVCHDLYTYICLYLSIFLHIHIYVYICMCICIYVYYVMSG